jgi:hypothetical protein
MAENNTESLEQAPPASGDEDMIERLTAILESDLEQPDQPDESDQEASDEADTVDDEFENVPDEDTAETEEVEDPTEDSEAEETDEELRTFLVDGETLSEEELKLGFLRQSDYTKKTQIVSEQRKAFEAQSQQAEATMSALMSAAGADLSRFEGVNWEAVAVDNPEQYRQAKAAFEQTRSTYDFIKAQSDQYQAQSQQQAEAAHKEAAKDSLTVLKTNIPGWNNDLYYKIGEYAQKDLGVTSEEFNEVADHRMITALYKAMQFDRAKQVTAKKKIKASPTKTLSGGKADASKATESDTSRKQRERLKRTGRIEDAAAVILNRMK